MEQAPDPRHIEALARELKKEFILAKRRRLGKVYKPSKRHDRFDYWRRAAEQCYELSAKPQDYVAAAFEQCKMSTGPFPNAMFGPAARGWWRSYVNIRPALKAVRDMEKEAGVKCLDSNFPSGQELELGRDIQQIRELLVESCGTWKLTEATLQKLRSRAFPIEPWARVLLTWTSSGGDPEVGARYGVETLEFLHARPNVLNAARILGFPMNDILQWLQSNNELWKTAHFPSLKMDKQ